MYVQVMLYCTAVPDVLMAALLHRSLNQEVQSISAPTGTVRMIEHVKVLQMCKNESLCSFFYTKGIWVIFNDNLFTWIKGTIETLCI